MRRIIAQAKKELRQISRDKLALALAFVLPAFLLVLLGSAISLTVSNLPIVVQDLDATSLSRKYAGAFRTSLTFHVVELLPSEQPEEALRNNQARAAIIIPEHFERDVLRGQNTEVQILVDATEPNTANLMRGSLAALTQIFIRANVPAAAKLQPAIKAVPRLWFNPGREAKKFFGPGIFVLGLSLFPPLLATLAMAREWEQKTILQVYVSSISAHEYLLGKIIAFTIIGIIEWMIGLVVLFGIFDLRIVADPSPFIVGSFLFMTCVVAFGIMVGAGVSNPSVAIQILAIGGFIMAFLLSGLIFPIETIPRVLQPISNIAQARYFVVIVRDALIRGGGWPAVWWAVLAIGVIAAVFYLLAWKKMRLMQLAD